RPDRGEPPALRLRARGAQETAAGSSLGTPISTRRCSERPVSSSSARIPVVWARCWISRQTVGGSATIAASLAAADRAWARSRRAEAEIVEDHRPDVEDERLRRVERLLDHQDEKPDLVESAVWVTAQEPLDDLRLEDDVGQALSGSVVHRPRDLATEVLLGV